MSLHDNTESGKMRNLLFYHRLALVLALLVAATLAAILFIPSLNELTKPKALKEDTRIPYYYEIKKIIGDIKYSGFQTLARPEVNLSIDFKNKKWILKNLHRLDAQGHVYLEEGHYGLCGQLSDYVYRKVKPLFGDRYSILFVHSAESGYFLGPRSSHYVLKITEQARPSNVYIIDPSFGRYGRLEDFADYLFYDANDRIYFENDAVLESPSGLPVLITKGFIVDLSVENTDDKFDPLNFSMTLSATRQYHFSGRYIFALRVKEGNIQWFEDKELAAWLVGNEVYKKLRTRLTGWFIENIRAANPAIDVSSLNALIA